MQPQVGILPDTMASSQAKAAALLSSTAGGAITNDASMHQWLAAGFWALLLDRHRHMFLAAATLMHAQPLRELRSAWTAMVQLDDGCGEDAAARNVDSCLAKLVASSLMSVSEGFFWAASWDDLHGCECVSTASFTASSACVARSPCACTAPRCDVCMQL